MGRIVPFLSAASLIGIRPLCKAGCTVVFDDKKCNVMYNGMVILRGFKDPSTDLWTLPIPKNGVYHPRTKRPATIWPLYQSCPTPTARSRSQPSSHHCSIIHTLCAHSLQCCQVCTPVIVQPQDIHPCQGGAKRVPQRVPKHDRNIDPQIPQCQSGNHKGTHEVPPTWDP